MAGALRPDDALVARAPGAAALRATRAMLRAYPAALLERAAAHPIRIWLLDPGEPVGSAALLDEKARARRWHGGRIGLENCAGLTTLVSWGVLVVAPWARPAVLRHELGHALSALLSGSQRRGLERLYRAARARRRLVVPLAAVSVGEYVACGIAHYARPELRRRLAAVDPALAEMLGAFWQPDTRKPRLAQRGPTRAFRPGFSTVLRRPSRP